MIAYKLSGNKPNSNYQTISILLRVPTPITINKKRMYTSTAVSPTTIQQWLQDNLTVDRVQTMLHELGHDSETIEEVVKEFKRLTNAKRQFSGFILLGIGALMGFISCVLTIVNPFPDLYYWILIGLTSLAAILICWGLYQVFE